MIGSSSSIGYQESIKQVSLFTKNGPFGVKIERGKFIPCSWKETCQSYALVILPFFRKKKEHYLVESLGLIQKHITLINNTHRCVIEDSSEFHMYSAGFRVIELWNQCFSPSNNVSWLQRITRCIQNVIGVNWRSSKYQDRLFIKPAQIMTRSGVFSSEQFSCYYLNPQKMPLVISPNDSQMTLETFGRWVDAHRNQIKMLIADHGAILLRNFPIASAADFASTIKSVLGQDLIDYLGGEGSRTNIIRGVYTSTEAPSWFTIPLHNELSCTANPVQYICFYCDTAPLPGSGQTILGRTKEVTEAMKKKFRVWNFFNDKQIKYISRHPPEGSLFNAINKTHKTWHSSFRTRDKQEVERICRAKNFKFRWIKDWIEVVRQAPAFKTKENGEVYWFNQTYLYHANPRGRGGWLNHILASLLYTHPQTRQYDVQLADGSSIPRSIMYDIYDVLEQSTIKFDWQKRDALIVNNVEALHGRASYSGPRRILTAMVQ